MNRPASRRAFLALACAGLAVGVLGCAPSSRPAAPSSEAGSSTDAMQSALQAQVTAIPGVTGTKQVAVFYASLEPKIIVRLLSSATTKADAVQILDQALRAVVEQTPSLDGRASVEADVVGEGGAVGNVTDLGLPAKLTLQDLRSR